MDLTEIQGGEVATTNLHSCNGSEFVLQLHMSRLQDHGMLMNYNSIKQYIVLDVINDIFWSVSLILQLIHFI
jgi:hypothetical protein